jgi:hypothetical protein
MAFEEIGERLEGKGWLGVGIGALILAPMVIPAVARGLRPVAKEAIKGYLVLSDRAREMLAEGGEQIQDLVAEARSEYETEVEENGMMMMSEGEESAEDEESTETSGKTARSRKKSQDTEEA